MGVDIAQGEGHGSPPCRRIGRTVDVDALHLAHPVKGIGRQLDLVLAYLVHAQVCQVVYRRAQANRLDDSRCTRFKLPG